MGFVDFSNALHLSALRVQVLPTTLRPGLLKQMKTSHQDGSEAPENGVGAETLHLRDILNAGAAVITQRAPG